MSNDFQKRKLAYFFKILDLNRNGILQKIDFSQMVEKVCEKFEYEISGVSHRRVSDKANKLFNKLLSDIQPYAFNQITEEEWVEFFYDKVVNSKNELIIDTYKELIFNFMFDFFDPNRDGYISNEEYHAFYEIFGIDESYCDKAFAMIESNKSHKLSRYDIMKAIEEFLMSEDSTLGGNWIFGNWETEPHKN